MAFKKLPFFIIILIIISSHFTLTSQLRHRRHHRRHSLPPETSSSAPSRFQPHIPLSLLIPSPSFAAAPHYHPATAAATPAAGEWSLLQHSIGISAMHMQLLHNNKVVIFDRTDFGPSNLTLPAGKCRFNDEAIPEDCTAHSVLYDVASNAFRPLAVQTDVWCSSGAVNPNGTLIQTGGYHDGDHKIRLFTPCDDDDQCDWIELMQNLTVQRWYASDHILPDGRVIIVGGRRAFSYEFFPKNAKSVFYFPFLKETTDPKEENNLYPFLYLLPDGNLFVFANKRSIILDYVNDKIIKELPIIPGEKRTYPATGSSIMLPLRLTNGGGAVVEVMVCGGAKGGAYVKAVKGLHVAASRSCGRIRVFDPDPKWVMEDMPMGRVMSDMVLLPTGDVIIMNGAAKGTAGWECAVDPVLNPVMYYPNEPDLRKRFSVLNPTTIARMYHSAAILLPDGRILVGGSNPHVTYNFTNVRYPTELSLEAFDPPYLAPQYAYLRPSILSVESLGSDNVISYGQDFAITFSLGVYQPAGEYMVTMVAPAFTTHSFGMNQRLLVLYIVELKQLSAFGYKVRVHAPPSANVAPPGYYMVFLVHQGVPSHSVWIRMM